ncbi:MAG TPA: hypothetical protein VGO46_01240 [Gemmatimonadaceae bacterium]|nr:hypothetical protein [Gemmatimonadaceae bacterium]
MEDSPEDLPKPPRRTAARPFFTPRAEGTTGPLELSRRRAAQLFTPPGSSPAAPIADKLARPDSEADSASDEMEEITSSAADGSIEMTADASTDTLGDEPESYTADASESADDDEVEHDVDFDGDWTPKPLVEPDHSLDAESRASTNLSDDDRLHIEQYEHEDIELTAAASNVPDEHAIEVIGYDDANSLLKAATEDGKTPLVDGLRLESTEFSFEQAPPAPTINVDSFWANEPFAKVDMTSAAASTPAAADETEAMIDEATAGEDEPELAIERFGTEPSIDEQPFEWADDPSTTIAHAQAALEPEPEHDPEPELEPELEAAPMLADIAPPWMNRATPASVQSLEELKESEPWDLTPSHSHAAIPAAPLVSAAPIGHDIADALERIAARVRDGDLDVPAHPDLSDEAALSAVLTALLRSRR